MGMAARVLSLEEMSNILSDVETTNTVDLGFAFVNFAIHPEHGSIALISTCGEKHMMIQEVANS